MKQTNLIALFLFLILISFPVKAQFVITDQMVNRSNNTLKKIELDNSLISVFYQFKQQVEIDNKPEFVTDTTLLEIGTIYSLYCNISSQWRDSIYSAQSSAVTQDMVKNINVVRNIAEFENIAGQNAGGINYETSMLRFNTQEHENLDFL